MSAGHRRFLLPLLLRLLPLALLFAGCDRERATAEKVLRRVGTERLRRDAAILYKDLQAAPGPAFRALKEDRWPESFRAFKPRHVGIYRDGFSLALTHTAGGERGLYITPLTMEAEPAASEGVRFEPIAEGVRWYHFAR